MRTRDFGSGFLIKDHITGADGNVLRFLDWEPISPKSDIEILAIANTGSHHMEGGFTILLVEDS